MLFLQRSEAGMTDEGFGAIMSFLDAPLIVVTAAEAREKAGCLVGFHCQSSIEPSRYCVWLSKANHTYRVALGSTHLAIHFLTASDLWLAERFGTLTGDSADKFAGLPARPGPGQVPVLKHCRHWLVARRGTLLDEGGDHVCMITEPVDVHAGEPFQPLRLSQAAHLEPGHGSRERHSPPTERAARSKPPGAIA
jgi:flavin reductase (DIM6/NTAB) family NADH-FMN oxidoreductase RutF